jgi:hypothetical protein
VGKWYKVLGYNPNYDTYPCQINTFTPRAEGGLNNDIAMELRMRSPQTARPTALELHRRNTHVEGIEISSLDISLVELS